MFRCTAALLASSTLWERASGCAPGDEVCEAQAQNDADDLALLALRASVKRHGMANSTKDGLCCYDTCGSCRTPDEFCNTQQLCEAPQSENGCAGSWLTDCDETSGGGETTTPAPPSEDGLCCYDTCGSCRTPDEFCNTQQLCEASQADSGCAGTWLTDCNETSGGGETETPAPPSEDGLCCYDTCGSCRTPDEFCNTKGLCEASQADSGCAGTWLTDCDETTSALPTVVLATAKSLLSTKGTDGLCCYDTCGSCRVPDEFCNTQQLCEASQADSGCAGTWLTDCNETN